MAEHKSIYRCQQCGYISPKWMGKCPECQVWDSFSEEVAPGRAGKIGFEKFEDCFSPSGQPR